MAPRKVTCWERTTVPRSAGGWATAMENGKGHNWGIQMAHKWARLWATMSAVG